MDEDEYSDYLYQIDLIEQRELAQERRDTAVWEQIRDEDGFRTPGCYRTLPARTE
jgi:hypothetical protein